MDLAEMRIGNAALEEIGEAVGFRINRQRAESWH